MTDKINLYINSSYRRKDETSSYLKSNLKIYLLINRL